VLPAISLKKRPDKKFKNSGKNRATKLKKDKQDDKSNLFYISTYTANFANNLNGLKTSFNATLTHLLHFIF